MEGINYGGLMSTEDPVRCRTSLIIISFLDFLIGFLLMTIWSLQLCPTLTLVDNALMEFFGLIGVIWLFLLYSLQLIMAMILCSGTQKISLEKSGLKFSRWFKTSILLCTMLSVNNLFFLNTVGLQLETIPGYLVNVLQIIFRIFSMAFLIVSNRTLLFRSNLPRHSARYLSRNIHGDIGFGGPFYPPPPMYPDFPPTYEEATTDPKYSTSKK